MSSLFIVTLQVRAKLSRQISCSSKNFNWDKYAIGKSFHSKFTKKLQMLDGKDAKKTKLKKSLLAFDVEDEKHLSSKSSHTKSREKMIAETVYDAIQLFLSSNTTGNNLRNISIEITKVEMTSSLSNARVFWSLPSNSESSISEEDAEQIIDENLELIRSSLPAYHTLSRSPNVSFYYDIRDRERRKLEELLDRIKDN